MEKSVHACFSRLCMCNISVDAREHGRVEEERMG